MTTRLRRSTAILLTLSIAGLSSLALWLAIRLSPVAEVTAPEIEVSAPDPVPTAIPQPFPTTPPDASKIAVSDPNDEGYATVTGTAGAVEALSTVVVVNLKASTLMTATADADGAFALDLYAPPGSSLLIKYDPKGDQAAALWAHSFRWDDMEADVSYFNRLPGTIIHVGAPTPGDGTEQAFHSVGRVLADEGWTGWWLSGTLQVPSGSPPGLRVVPGDVVTMSSRVRVTAPGYTCTAVPTVTLNGEIHLEYLFAGDGRAYPSGTWFAAYLFTPTGLPVEHETPGARPDLSSGGTFSPLTCLADHVIEGSLIVTFTVPADLPEGFYLPKVTVSGDVPASTDVPSAVVWFHIDEVDSLPPIRVGDAAPPHIPWTLLSNYPVNGHRGLQAREDVGRYQMPTRVLYPPHKVVIPRFDDRTGEPLVYRLEPGSNWLSSTDRRHPNPPHIPLQLPSGELTVEVLKPDGSTELLGPAPIAQSSSRSPTLPDGSFLHEGTGHVGNIYHLTTMSDTFDYVFDQYGKYTIIAYGEVFDIFGNPYPIAGTYDVTVARILDLDPAQLPTTPYQQGNAFAPGLHVFPPVPADVTVQLVHMPYSDPAQAITTTITGQANRFGIFQPPVGTVVTMTAPGEFRVDWTAVYTAEDGTLWAGTMTWGNVVEGTAAQIAAHGRRGMDYSDNVIDDMPAWFETYDLYDNHPDKFGIEVYYPYFGGDVHWGDQYSEKGGDSIHSIITVEDLTGSDEIYDLLIAHYPRATNTLRRPPNDSTVTGLVSRTLIDEAPLFITTKSGINAAVDPQDIDMWGYWYGSSERPDVRVREIVSEDGMGTAYWRFDDTYAYQIGEPADGDQPGDIKWEFGGAVLRTITDTDPLNEYAIYSSLWVMLPPGDAQGPRVTPPFRGANGTSIDGGPILTMTVEGEVQEIDVLFLPKCVRPGDILELGQAIAFCGHVGPPLNSRVSVTITSPSNTQLTADMQANKVGWLYDPELDISAGETGRWTVDVYVEHDQNLIYASAPFSNATGTVMGTTGRYEFYVVGPDASRLLVTAPEPGVIVWPSGNVEPVHIRGIAPAETTEVRYTIHDKGVVMDQGSVLPDANGTFTVTYDALALHQSFSMLSLTAHEGRWEGLADEVEINLLALGTPEPLANTVTLIGEEVFVGNALHTIYLPTVLRNQD